MKEIFRNNIILTIMIVVLIGLLSSCGPDWGSNDRFNVNTSKYVNLYMPQARHNPNKKDLLIIDSTYTYIYGAAYGGAGKPASDIKINFEVNPALVDTFNLHNFTSYKLLPKGSYQMQSDSMNVTIPASQKSTQPLKLKISPLGHLKDDVKYLLPITLTEENGNVKINKEKQTTYFLVSGSYAQIDRSKWKIIDYSSYISNISTYHPSKLFDGAYGYPNYWLTVNPLPQYVTVDMGANHLIVGFNIVGNGSNASGSFVDRDPEKVKFQISNDGTHWSTGQTFHVSINGANNTASVFLSEPIKARYFKFTVLKVNNGDVMNVGDLSAFY
jgi:hypothetical protein